MDAIDKAVEVLNRLLKTDPEACSRFIELETQCNEALADDPDIQVGSIDGKFRIRPLGVINGILGPITEGEFKGWGPITLQMEEDGTIIKFSRTEAIGGLRR